MNQLLIWLRFYLNRDKCRQILALALLGLLPACSLNHDPRPLLNQLVAKEMQVLAQSAIEIDSFHAVMRYRSWFHHASYLVSYYPTETGELSNYAGQNLQLLWRQQLAEFDLSIQYDQTLQPCIAELKSVILADYFPTQFRMTAAHRLQLSLVLTAQSGFIAVNPIDRQTPTLTFVFRYLCGTPDKSELFQQIAGKIYHETTHYFQSLDSRDYDKHYPAGEQFARQRALLRETVASMRQYCARMLAPAFTAFYIEQPAVDMKISLNSTVRSAAEHSLGGDALSIIWLARFSDNDGRIDKNNPNQYQKVIEACQIEHAELVAQAAAIVAERAVEPTSQPRAK